MRTLVYLIFSGLISCAAFAQGPIVCGELTNQFGPHDYRTATPAQKELVERFHFTADVEALTHGSTGAYPGGDLDYTLRAFPNHPRALRAMSKLEQKEKAAKPRGAHYSADCYFDRAIRFRPDDGDVRMLYGIHLLQKGVNDGAIRELEKAQELSGANANVHYNLGLAYLELGDYQKSLDHAKQAYALGFPLPGLRDRLKRAGKWQP